MQVRVKHDRRASAPMKAIGRRCDLQLNKKLLSRIHRAVLFTLLTFHCILLPASEMVGEPFSPFFSFGQLPLVLTGPVGVITGAAQGYHLYADGSNGLCPSSWRHLFNRNRFDLNVCYEALLPLIPLAVLLLFGGAEAWSLRKLQRKRLSGWRGLGLYRLKLVRASG